LLDIEIIIDDAAPTLMARAPCRYALCRIYKMPLAFAAIYFLHTPDDTPI